MQVKTSAVAGLIVHILQPTIRISLFCGCRPCGNTLNEIAQLRVVGIRVTMLKLNINVIRTCQLLTVFIQVIF